MKKALVLMAVMILAALVIFGCTRSNDNYQTGYAAYGQPNQGQQQGYVGGGCGVAGPEPTAIPDFEPTSFV